jgi:hypothetical protein
MKIKEVKTAFKIMDAALNNDNTISFNYLETIYDENGNELPQSILTTNYARVYLIVVNGVIKKIGGSEDKGGMKGTLAIYKDGGVKGRPSIRSYGIHCLLLNELKAGKKIEFYMIYQDDITSTLKGLFGTKPKQKVRISYKYLEDSCKLDYKLRENDALPDWNFQEQGMDWPALIKKLHADLMIESTKREKTKGRK